MAKLTAEWIPKDKYLPPHETFILGYIDLGAIDYRNALYKIRCNPGKCLNTNQDDCYVYLGFYWMGRFDQYQYRYKIDKETPILIKSFGISCHSRHIEGKIKDKYPTIDELNNILLNPFDSWTMTYLACWQSLQ